MKKVKEKIKVLIVEDYPNISELIQLGLEEYNYQVTGIITKGEEVVAHVQKHQPDVVLMDINLEGEMNGVEAAKLVRSCSDTIIIYITDLTDEDVFKKAVEAFPSNYLNKPFNAFETNRAIEVALFNHPISDKKEPNANKLFGKFLFLKQPKSNYKVATENIMWIEAENPNSKIKTETEEFFIKKTMKTVSEFLEFSSATFIQVHQSFIVNVDKVLEYTDDATIIMEDGSQIPLGRSYKNKFKEITL